MRRPVLWIALSAAALGVLLLSLFFLGPVRRAFSPTSAPRVELPVSGIRPGEVRLVKGLWVARQRDGAFFVFLNLDPHLYHPTQWVESEGLFHSPAHGELYGLDGACRGGPCGSDPPATLFRVQAEREADHLTVYPTRVISGGFSNQARPSEQQIMSSLAPDGQITGSPKRDGPAPRGSSTDEPRSDTSAGDLALSASPAFEVWGHFQTRRVSPPGEGRFTIDTGRFQVIAPAVRAGSAEEAAGALNITGAQLLWPPDVRPAGDAWQVSATVAPGQPGETVTVAVRSAPGAPPATATLVRKSGPTARILLQGADGAWSPLSSGVSLPPGPKKLRLQTVGVTVTEATIHVYGAWQHGEPERRNLVAPDLLELEFPDPPPMVQVVISGGLNPDGLKIPPTSAHFYIGEPPVLMAVDSETGAAFRIGQVPPEILRAAVGRDGRYLALATLSPEGVEGFQAWLVDLTTGKVTRTPFAADFGTGYPDFDARGRLIAPLNGGQLGVLDPVTGKAETLDSAATFWSAVSPDGRYLAGRGGPPPGRGTGAWVGPPKADHLVIHNLTTDREQVFPWEGYAFSGGLYWLPDGRLLQMTVDSDQPPGPTPGPETTVHCNTVDPDTGVHAEYPGPCRVPRSPDPEYRAEAGEQFLGRLPDGRALVVRWPNLANQRRPLGP